MIFEGSNLIRFIAFGLILVVFALKMKRGGFFKRMKADVTPGFAGLSGRLFERHSLPTTKKCPKCARELQVSILICETCEYNFLSGTVGVRNKLLPPAEPMNPSLPQHA